jgi:hypothetical protein
MSEIEITRKYVTVKELSKIYGISLSTASNMTFATGCPVIRFGRAKRIDIAEFDKWMKNEFQSIVKRENELKRYLANKSKMDPDYLARLRENKQMKKKADNIHGERRR